MNTHRKQSEREAHRGVIEGVVLRPAASAAGFVGPEPNSSFDLRMWKKSSLATGSARSVSQPTPIAGGFQPETSSVSWREG